MRLTPTERDRLLLFTAAELARARKSRGLQLNAPEATAIIADTVIEAARSGQRLRDAVDLACNVLDPDDVLPGVAALVPEVWVEAVFDDGSRLVVVPEPLGPPHGGDAVPGSIHPAHEDVDAATAPTLHLEVRNTSEVPISVTSHFHFFEVNPRLSFDRAAAYGMRLAIDAGEAIRFDPHATLSVGLTPIGGQRVVIGFAGLVDGALDAPGAKEAALMKARATGFLDSSTDIGSPGGAPA
jgi:urease subunit gamma/beta